MALDVHHRRPYGNDCIHDLALAIRFGAETDLGAAPAEVSNG